MQSGHPANERRSAQHTVSVFGLGKSDLHLSDFDLLKKSLLNFELIRRTNTLADTRRRRLSSIKETALVHGNLITQDTRN